ncbi:histone PARylation factor 1-like [Bactrocera dorsalis]|uniref:Histone PARylation factor 1-like n=1 Tax=Bactrocera dorsalis TaxID=27457 RepID=A0A6I9VI06_BACDO|nr:histone PARylation factor 1-like [Bactrocera dorsalis]
MPKQDCKYWEKCYQKNSAHLEKYNHPPKNSTTDSTADYSPVKGKEAQKRKTTEDLKQEPKTDDSLNNLDMDVEATVSKNTSTGERKEIDTDELRAEALGNIAGKNYMEILAKRIKFSVQAEYDELLRSNEFIRHKFLVEMPPDFYDFWKFANTLKKNATGEEILQYFENQFQLQLVGPFEFLAGRFHKAKLREPGDYLRHWRFFYDPPEFQTILVRRDTGVHYGYWRDLPKDNNCLLIARNDSLKNCKFEFIAGNVFDAFLHYLDKDFTSTPFTATLISSTRKSLQMFINANEIKLEKLETLRKRRSAKVVAKTFHEAGIVVPYEGNTQVGYRPLIVSDGELKKILELFVKAGPSDDNGDNEEIKAAVIEKLQPVATAANIAMDECDFGTSLELGIDLFCSGRKELHSLVQSLLVPAYSLLSRPQFIAISKAHMEQRSKTLKLSIFELDAK